MNALPIIALAALLAAPPPRDEPARPRVLVFTRTLAYRHESIPTGIAAVRELGAEGGFVVDATEDAAAFTRENLGRYRAIVFLNTSGDVLDERQKAAFQGFIQGGGGLAAVHQGDHHARQVAVVRRPGRRREIRRAPEGPAGDMPVRGPRSPGHEVLARTLVADRRVVQLRTEPPPAIARPDDGQRVVLPGRDDGQGPPDLLVSRGRQGSSLVHGPGAHEGGLWRAGFPPAPARGHPVGRGPRRVGARRDIGGRGRPRLRGDRARGHGLLQGRDALGDLLYGKRGAGFASILDKDGHDWVSYRPGGKARGEYRGLPKCGQPTKFFHCGYGYGQYQTENPFSSRVTVQEAGRVRIESETRDGKSACRWDFYPDHATLTLLRIDLPTFWFLYEGTPGGTLVAEKDFVIRPDGTKTTLDHAWSQVVPWVCFGASETPVGLVLVNHQDPEPGEVDSYVSWPFRKDETDGSFRDMTVFGFGRKGHEQLIQHVPDLKRLPARFSIGFVDRADYPTARAACERLRSEIADKASPR